LKAHGEKLGIGLIGLNCDDPNGEKLGWNGFWNCHGDALWPNGIGLKGLGLNGVCPKGLGLKGLEPNGFMGPKGVELKEPNGLDGLPELGMLPESPMI
jgi:hypothetical protein